MHSSRTHGFSIIEVTVGISVMSIGLLPLLGLLVVGNNLRSESEVTYRLQQIATNHLEELVRDPEKARGLLADMSLGSASFAVDAAKVEGLPISAVSGWVDAELLDGDAILVRVTITYREKGDVLRNHTVGTVVSEQAR